MNAFLNPHNNTSLTSIIDVTTHSISLFQENEQPKSINDIFIPQIGISIAKHIGVKINELGNNIPQRYQLIGEINYDEEIPGLESVLNYMNAFPLNKHDPAINEHHHHITKKQYNQETHSIYKIGSPKTYNISK